MVRYRIDGILSEKRRVPKALQPAVVNRIKILANMDIAEKRIPQDGRHTLKFEDREIDLRISSFPTINGEKMVLRILNKALAKTSIEDLGMGEETRNEFMRLLKKPEGMLVVTGPTGSGKTSTLYATLNYTKAMEKNLVTLEDPVELEIEGVNQGQVYDHPEFSFASGLRAILRQDPNIILVGEVRDKETAQIAIQAALTGHLVLTTLHTNSAAAAIPRLIDMGIEPYLLTASLVGILAQRLVRVICPHCREEHHAPDEMVRSLLANADPASVKLYRGKGCPRCTNGYKSRTGIFELLTVDDEVQRLISRGAQTPEVRAKARERGMTTLRDDAIRKALAGVTTIDEVFRVTFVDM
ncbi:MAG: type II/IV secretion system protein [Planctomycetes bacterium]|nr:type II/IV secretion system protein [Planctomycetota bacterium]